MRLLTVGISLILMASGISVMAADSDSVIADRLYTKPLTYVGENTRNFMDNPRNHTREPRNFRDNPIQWRETPIGYRETPIPQLAEPRNGLEDPPRFTERDAIVQSNPDPEFVVEKEVFPLNNNRDDVLRIETQDSDGTRIKNNFSSREQGYSSQKSPIQARLKDFQR